MTTFLHVNVDPLSTCCVENIALHVENISALTKDFEIQTLGQIQSHSKKGNFERNVTLMDISSWWFLLQWRFSSTFSLLIQYNVLYRLLKNTLLSKLIVR